ncbi:MAG TPA: sigma-54 dependent transcriptional regulator [Gammaproteobacteria bacterium]|nr:sigma-54 dependent transcriptional regulator [Gammaproteobacteria bacterium]
MANVLLVDDEPDFVAAAKEMLQLHGHTVESAERLESARRLLGGAAPDVLLLDLMLPDGNGLELLEELRASPVKRVVFITGHPGIKSLIKNLSGPSVSYLTKPIGSTELLRTVEADGSTQNGSATPNGNLHFGCLIGESPAMLAVYEQIDKVARTPSPVLILGETGTGKELVAESIHRASGRPGQFVAVNCGSLSRELAASELFGHEKGSFTGAVRRHPGFFKRADGGTLFLDELAEMPVELQPHFLRVLETGSVLPVGSEREVPIDARTVAATNRDPKKAIADKALREDLYYRLSVFPITLPPLRARIQDVPLLVDHFLGQAQTASGPETRRFSAEDSARLRGYHWPGNVRELRHVVLRAAIMTDPNEALLRLPERFDSPFNEPNGQQGLAIGRSIRDVERELIMRTLEHLNGDKRAAAETLGISLNTLYNRLNAYEAAGMAAPAAPPMP